jgi:hypothetical protein
MLQKKKKQDKAALKGFTLSVQICRGLNVRRGRQSLNTGPRFYLRLIRRTGWLWIYTSRTTDGRPFKPKKLSVPLWHLQTLRVGWFIIIQNIAIMLYWPYICLFYFNFKSMSISISNLLTLQLVCVISWINDFRFLDCVIMNTSTWWSIVRILNSRLSFCLCCW